MHEPLGNGSPAGQLEHSLEEHEKRSHQRHSETMEKLGKIHKHAKHKSESEGEQMAVREDMNVIGGFPHMGGYGYGGDGFGGGIGLIALLALLGRRDGFGGGWGGDGGGVAGLNNLQGAIDTNAILSKLGTLEGAVPLAESQTQLAIANSNSNITQQQLQQTIALQQQGFQAQLAAQMGFANVGDKVDTLSAAQALGFGNVGMQIAQNGWAVTQAINTDGEKTRALIGQIDRENLNRIITTQATELVELRNEGARERDRHGIEINMVNNQNQNQMQFQQQAQLLGGLAHVLTDVSQVARATNQNLIVGNTGATTTGPQTANPVNVRT